MYSSRQFESLERMCRERAAHARKELEFWLAEAEEWKRLKDSPSLSPDSAPAQLDWSAEFDDRGT
jgi:hypothetical protein